ncbi:hypothetical protein HU200_013325 [Digitaria exilis]|uniref:Uncharacterized protein n=1 Tax=Digitaria exilis TaxID=1010633 RepID=A0A835KL56_9POAL|nr:hypothetical protein HU200_013325 [Digitaria exilis]
MGRVRLGWPNDDVIHRTHKGVPVLARRREGGEGSRPEHGRAVVFGATRKRRALYLEGMRLEVVAGRDDEPRILDLAMPARGGVLRVFAMPGQGSGELWEPEKTIQLSAVAAGLLGYLPSYFSGVEAVEWINVTDAAAVVGVSFGHGDAGGGARGRRCRTSGMWRSHANCHGRSNLQLHTHDHSKNPSNVDGCTNTVTISVSVTLMHASCSSLPHK